MQVWRICVLWVSACESLSAARSSATKRRYSGSSTLGRRLNVCPAGRPIDCLHRRIRNQRAPNARADLAAEGTNAGHSVSFQLEPLSVIAGLSRTNYLFQLYEGSVKKEQVVEFLNVLWAAMAISAIALASLRWGQVADGKRCCVREQQLRMGTDRGGPSFGFLRTSPTCQVAAEQTQVLGHSVPAS